MQVVYLLSPGYQPFLFHIVFELTGTPKDKRGQKTLKKFAIFSDLNFRIVRIICTAASTKGV